MQTIQFKVLNTDTQETNVQMQTENTEAGNKAQNTQNTEVSGVESTEESAGTKKKTTVSTGQTGVTDAESARWVAGLQLKKCALYQNSLSGIVSVCGAGADSAAGTGGANQALSFKRGSAGRLQ